MKQKILPGLLIAMLCCVATPTLSYAQASGHAGHGGGGGSKAGHCKSLKFTQIKPPPSSEVAPGSDFSFSLSNAKADSIKVEVKGIETDVTITDKGFGQLKVAGQLPSSLDDEFAKINVTANDIDGCYGRKGWLLKITGSANTTAP